MAKMQVGDLVLLIVTFVVVIADIVLALCLRFVLPQHVTHQGGFYPVGRKSVAFDKASEICPCLHRIFPDGTQETINFDKISSKAVSKRSLGDLIAERVQRYPYLVSLSIPAYSDDLEQKMFACNGLILSDEWILTTKNCVHDNSEWYEITVRSGSPFWSMFGQEHSVLDFVEDDGLIKLKVWPKISDMLVLVPPIRYPFDGNWTYAVSLGWNDQMYKQELKFRHKYKIFDVDEWTLKDSDSISSKVCSKLWGCGELSSKPLMTSCHQLIGMESAGEDGCSGFSTLSSIAKDRGLNRTDCYSIYEDTGVVRELEVCES